VFFSGSEPVQRRKHDIRSEICSDQFISVVSRTESDEYSARLFGGGKGQSYYVT